METTTRYVRDLDAAERSALERLVGHALREDQRVVIQVQSAGPPAMQAAPADAGSSLPDWCNVYEGLSDTEIADIEKSIIRSQESRSLD